jgi:hypothetical protein
MGLLAQLWLPIVLSAVFVFVASSILHMVLKFWHTPDYRGFSNEDEVGAAIRNGNAAAGMYNMPYCTPEKMKDPAMQDKFRQGPIGVFYLRKPGVPNMGTYLGQWFAFCLFVAFLCALLAVHVFGAGADHRRVFHVIALAAFMGHGLGPLPSAIWWGQPWRVAIKHTIDGLIFAILTGLTFAWLWPA